MRYGTKYKKPLFTFDCLLVATVTMGAGIMWRFQSGVHGYYEID